MIANIIFIKNDNDMELCVAWRGSKTIDEVVAKTGRMSRMVKDEIDRFKMLKILMVSDNGDFILDEHVDRYIDSVLASRIPTKKTVPGSTSL
jgi:hypothetical protein